MRAHAILLPICLAVGLAACGGEKEELKADAQKVADIQPAAPPPELRVEMVDTHVICIIRDSNDEIYYVSDGAILTAAEGEIPATDDISADYEAFIKGRYNVGASPSRAECELAVGGETAEALVKRVTNAVYDAGGFVTSVGYTFEPESAT